MNATKHIQSHHDGTAYCIVPRITCVDGFSMSVQANRGSYCEPRNGGRGPWSLVEVGYPSTKEELLMPYADSPESPTETVYGYVPIAVVDEVIAKHGGITK